MSTNLVRRLIIIIFIVKMYVYALRNRYVKTLSLSWTQWSDMGQIMYTDYVRDRYLAMFLFVEQRVIIFNENRYFSYSPL
jgi:hypothetical protein